MIYETAFLKKWLLPLVIVGFFIPLASARDLPEVQYPNEDFKQLGTYEGHVLNGADKIFRKENYRRAAKEYNAFMMEFPRSKALPYALLRRGRCLQESNKRYKAIKEYQEVLDYFPNQVRYAAAALFYQGQCHKLNGDWDKALKAWSRMAQDKEYSEHYLAGTAFTRLADHLMKNKKPEKAVEYYRLVIKNFWGKVENHTRRRAINRVIRHYLRRKPNVEELAEFYKTAGRFGWRRRHDVAKKPLESKEFWKRVINQINDKDDFDQFQKGKQKRFFGYWAEAMQERAEQFPDWDHFHLWRTKYAYYQHGNKKKYYREVDQIFQKRLTEDNRYNRIINWMKWYKHHKNKVVEYFEKIDLKKLSGGQAYNLIHVLTDADRKKLAKKTYPWVKVKDLNWHQRRRLLRMLYRRLHDREMAHNFFNKLNLPQASDKRKEYVADTLKHHDRKLLMRCYNMMKNQERADYLKLKYWHWQAYHERKLVDEGIQAAKPVLKSPKYAKQGYWLKAELHDYGHQWKKAIEAYQKAGKKPKSLFRIAEAYMHMGKLDEAIRQLQEIEKFFKGHRAKAAYIMAKYYRKAGERAKEIAALRHVMKKYPRSGESRHAHERLEALGVKMGGGTQKAVED